MGDKDQISGIVFPVYASNKSLTFESLTPAVATVDANGIITPVSEVRLLLKLFQMPIIQNLLSVQLLLLIFKYLLHLFH